MKQITNLETKEGRLPARSEYWTLWRPFRTNHMATKVRTGNNNHIATHCLEEYLH